MIMDEEDTSPAEESAELRPSDENGVPHEGQHDVLTQEEISSLLKTEGKTGIAAILNTDMVYYERLPMLEVVFERLVRLLSTSLRNFTCDNVEVTIEEMTSQRYGDYLAKIPGTSMLNIVLAEEWGNHGMITLDTDLIYAVVDVLLGGRRGVAPVRMDSRPFTTIERNLMERMVQVILSDMSAAFDPISPITFRFERLETNHRFANIVRTTNSVYIVSMKVELDERSGRIDVVLPYATLEPIRDLLLQNFMGEKFGRDSIWENHLAGQLWETDLTLDVVLEELSTKLHEVLEWKVGTQLILNATTRTPVKINCGGAPMFVGQMGRKGKNLAIKIDKVLFGDKGDVSCTHSF